jgi:hypothetical protein
VLYKERVVGKLRRLDEEEVLDCGEGVLGSLEIGPGVQFILIGGEADGGGRLQEEQVGDLMPAVLVLGEHISELIGVAHDVGADLLDHADKAGAAGSAVQPNGQRGGAGVADVGLHEHVVDLAVGLGGVEVAGVDAHVEHSLSGAGSTGGEDTRSSEGSAMAVARSASRSNIALIIYLFIKRKI